MSTAKRPSRERNRLAFFVGFLREPQPVGSLVPSSRFLEHRIVKAAELSQARLVVELGPGTGGTTQAILRHLRPDARMLTIEMSRHFTHLLNNIKDPRLINHNGSAEHLPEILSEHGLASPDVVISGIPFSSIPAKTGHNIVRGIQDNLAQGGRFVAYQFRSDISRITQPIMGTPSSSTVMRNIPPLRVYVWRKSGDAP